MHLEAITLLMLVTLSRTIMLPDDHPYCTLRYRRLCQGKGQHVGCQFPYTGPGIGCHNYTQIKFTSELKSFIVHDINRRRQRVASGNERVRGGVFLPKPDIMMLVVWDRELAYLAQRLANQCNFVHDDCRATVKYPYAGQSVGEVRWRSLSGSDQLSTQRAIRRVFDAWWGERRRVTPKQLTQPFKLIQGMSWGHFSQLAVWSLRAVGCGAVTHGANFIRLLLVCDFSHTNMLGQRTLRPGPLALCPIRTERRPKTAFPLLCRPERNLEKNRNEMLQEEEESETQSFETDNDDEPDHTTNTKDLSIISTRLYVKGNKNVIPVQNPRKEAEDERNNYHSPKPQKDFRRVIGKFEQELDVRTLEPSTEFRNFYQWKTRPSMGKLHDYHERILETKETLNYHRNFHGRDEDFLRPSYGRVTSTETDYVLRHGSNTRRKWKHTRLRPQRPGAHALLNKFSTPVYLKSSSVSVSLMLDKDGLDQLFQDTGFSVN